VAYLTVGDPLTAGADVAGELVAGGVDVLELGIPTPNTAPRGEQVRDSFTRAAGHEPSRTWAAIRALRDALPSTPLLGLVYPQTVTDLGWDRLVSEAADAGVDGLVLTDPASVDKPEEVAEAGLSCVPLIRPDTPADRTRQRVAGR
jgi:tryptophan synthase alpha chain